MVKFTQQPAPNFNFCPFRHLRFFTDGSAYLDEGKAAWAFAAFGSIAAVSPLSDFRFLGRLGGPVVLDVSAKTHCGATAMDSMSAEASALYWATIFAFSVARRYDEIRFHYDASVVGIAMFAHFNVPKHHAIVGFLRVLLQALEAYMGPHLVHAHHVKAHCGHPLNELVNTLAQWVAQGHSIQLPDLDFTELLQDEAFALRWLWLLARSHRQCYGTGQTEA